MNEVVCLSAFKETGGMYRDGPEKRLIGAVIRDALEAPKFHL
jgi:hypothetical protein